MVLKRNGIVAAFRGTVRNPESELLHRQTMKERLAAEEADNPGLGDSESRLPVGLKGDVFKDPEFYDDEGRLRLTPLKKK